MSFVPSAQARSLLGRRATSSLAPAQSGAYVPAVLACYLLRRRPLAAVVVDISPTPASRHVGELIEQTAVDDQDWLVDWSGLGLGDDTIAGSAWSVTGTELVLSRPSHTGTTATIWISGGVEVGVYTITNTITTSGGRVVDKVFHCLVDA